jgi:hypothetical protein
MSYTVLTGRRSLEVVLNVDAPSEEKSDHSKDSFYEKLEQVFDHYLKHHLNIRLGDFNAKLWRNDIFKPTFGNESLLQNSNENGVRIINCATPKKNLVVKSTMFPHRKFHKHTWTCPDRKIYNQTDVY